MEGHGGGWGAMAVGRSFRRGAHFNPSMVGKMTSPRVVPSSVAILMTPAQWRTSWEQLRLEGSLAIPEKLSRSARRKLDVPDTKHVMRMVVASRISTGDATLTRPTVATILIMITENIYALMPSRCAMCGDGGRWTGEWLIHAVYYKIFSGCTVHSVQSD